jgi:hypothetical protein
LLATIIKIHSAIPDEFDTSMTNTSPAGGRSLALTPGIFYYSAIIPRDEVSMNRIPVIMCIDVEPDQREIVPNAYDAWSGFEITYQRFSELRHQLQSATGSPVHFSWFLRMDPQVAHAYGTAAWVARRYSSIIEGIRLAGDALGLHVHAWRWDEFSGGWIAEFGDQMWVEHSVRLGFESFRESVQQECLYFRFGDHWMNNETLHLVEKLGARFDLTVEPGLRGAQLHELFTGSFPDYDQVPNHPYRPSKSEFRRLGSRSKRRLWIIPLSTGSKDWTPQSFQVDAGSWEQNEGQKAPSLADCETGTFEGRLERVDSDLISGWVYDRQRPETALEVEIWDGDTFVTASPAATFRSDLLAAGKGDGRHCFNIVVPSVLKDGYSHSIRTNVKGTRFQLNNSPMELICRETSEADECVTLNLSSNPWSVCKIIDRLLANPETSHLAMVVRSDVARHADQYSHVCQTFDHILSHPRVGQLSFETPSEMIGRMSSNGVTFGRPAGLENTRGPLSRWAIGRLLRAFR